MTGPKGQPYVYNTKGWPTGPAIILNTYGWPEGLVISIIHQDAANKSNSNLSMQLQTAGRPLSIKINPKPDKDVVQLTYNDRQSSGFSWSFQYRN